MSGATSTGRTRAWRAGPRFGFCLALASSGCLLRAVHPSADEAATDDGSTGSAAMSGSTTVAETAPGGLSVGHTDAPLDESTGSTTAASAAQYDDTSSGTSSDSSTTYESDSAMETESGAQPVWHMDIQQSETSVELGAGATSQVYGELATAGSVLVGETVNTLVALLSRAGNPPGEVVFAVVDANLEIRYEFGRYPAAMIPSGADPTAIEVTNIDANYVMQADDHIVVWYDLGTSVDKLRIFLMATDVFDGQNSYRVRWSELEGWRSALSHDTSFRVGRTGLHP